MKSQKVLVEMLNQIWNDLTDVHKLSKRRSLNSLSWTVLLFVALIAASSMFVSCAQAKNVTKTFPTRTFTVGAHPKLVLHAKNADVHIQYGNAGSIKVEAKASASGLDIGPTLDIGSFKMNYTQSGDIVTVNADGNTDVIGGSKGFDITITVPDTTVIEGVSINVDVNTEIVAR